VVMEINALCWIIAYKSVRFYQMFVSIWDDINPTSLPAGNITLWGGGGGIMHTEVRKPTKSGTPCITPIIQLLVESRQLR